MKLIEQLQEIRRNLIESYEKSKSNPKVVFKNINLQLAVGE